MAPPELRKRLIKANKMESQAAINNKQNVWKEALFNH